MIKLHWLVDPFHFCEKDCDTPLYYSKLLNADLSVSFLRPRDLISAPLLGNTDSVFPTGAYFLGGASLDTGSAEALIECKNAVRAYFSAHSVKIDLPFYFEDSADNIQTTSLFSDMVMMKQDLYKSLQLSVGRISSKNRSYELPASLLLLPEGNYPPERIAIIIGNRKSAVTAIKSFSQIQGGSLSCVPVKVYSFKDADPVDDLIFKNQIIAYLSCHFEEVELKEFDGRLEEEWYLELKYQKNLLLVVGNDVRELLLPVEEAGNNLLSMELAGISFFMDNIKI